MRLWHQWNPSLWERDRAYWCHKFKNRPQNWYISFRLRCCKKSRGYHNDKQRHHWTFSVAFWFETPIILQNLCDQGGLQTGCLPKTEYCVMFFQQNRQDYFKVIIIIQHRGYAVVCFNPVIEVVGVTRDFLLSTLFYFYFYDNWLTKIAVLRSKLTQKRW